MHKYCLLLLLVCSLHVSAQDTTAVRDAVDRLERALVEKDTMTIKRLMHPHLQFGHSNGWVQTKQDAIQDMKTGALVYESYNRQSMTVTLFGKQAVVKEWAEVRGKRNGAEFNVRIFVMQQWVRTKQGWKLVMRQSAKQG